MRIIILTVFLLSTFSISYAQYDWTRGKLILKNGEVLKGLIKIPTPSANLTGLTSSKLKFKKDKKSKKKKFGSDKVSKVFFNTASSNIGYYEYVPIGIKKRALYKIIRNEKVKLYIRTIHYREMNYNGNVSTKIKKKKEYCLLRKGEKVVTFVDNTYDSELLRNNKLKNFKNTLIKYFSDCNKIVDYIENDIYQEFDIVQIVDDYNLFCE